ncbi:MAG TPA: diguanylate cyclase [Symbiobacteriaceae bacterium]|nr:diguanylate cyclase [Symbiobacteriaceae bacterium]
MRSYTPAARAYLVGMVILAALLTAYAWLFRPAPAPQEWLPFAFLTVAAAVAHLYPVRSAREGAFYVVANVFVFAAVILLSLPLIALHCLAVMLPYTILNYRRPRVWYRWSFNTAQTLVAAFAVRAIFLLSHRSAFDGPASLAVVLTAAVLFPFLQSTLVTVMLCFNNNIKFLSSPLLERDTLLAEITMALMGAMVAAVWHAQPWFALLMPLPMMIMYTLVRRVLMVPLAEFDAKTGLYNYRHFEQVASTEFVRAKTMRRPMSLLFMDLDYMRHINNRYGHLAGDYVLKELAGILIREARHGDVVARFGGEEFVALLPGTEQAEATYLAERIRHAVEHHTYCFEGQPIRVTISVGVVSYPVHGQEITELMQRADEALYAAKAEGRNRVKVCGCGEMQIPPEMRRPTLAAVAPVAAALQAEAPAPAPAAPVPPAATATAQTPAPTPTPTVAPPGPLAPAWYIAALPQIVATGGGLTLLWSLSAVTWPYPDWRMLGALALAALIAELLTVQVYEGNRQRVSNSMGVGAILAAVSLVDLTGALLVGLVSGVVHTLLSRRFEWSKVAFNLGGICLATTAAAAAYHLTPAARSATEISMGNLTGPALAAVAFYAVNTGLVALIIGLRARRNPLAIWKENLWYAPVFILSGLTGAFLGSTYEALGLVGAAIFLIPILVLRYFFSLYAGRMHRSIVALEEAMSRVEESNLEKEQTLDHLILTISAIIDARDRSVAGHSSQVSRYAVALAEELGLPPDEIRRIRTAALLHDLGKIGIPEAILHKPGRLTPEEYTVIQTHADLGRRILAGVPALQEVAKIVGEHHEYYNGRGYPTGKAGEEISVGGRILAVADTLDTILSDRPYSPAKPLSWALDELVRCSGTQFDPVIVSAVLRIEARPENKSLFVNSTHPPEGRPHTLFGQEEAAC